MNYQEDMPEGQYVHYGTGEIKAYHPESVGSMVPSQREYFIWWVKNTIMFSGLLRDSELAFAQNIQNSYRTYRLHMRVSTKQWEYIESIGVTLGIPRPKEKQDGN